MIQKTQMKIMKKKRKINGVMDGRIKIQKAKMKSIIIKNRKIKISIYKM